MDPVESGKAFYRALKAAGVEIPPRCHKVTIEAEIRGPLTVRFDCWADAPLAAAFVEAAKSLEAEACVVINTVQVESP